MELSIREAETRFVEAADAASRGEWGVATTGGRPFVRVILAKRAVGMDFAKVALVRRALGIDGLNVGLRANFDDPGFAAAAAHASARAAVTTVPGKSHD